VNDELREQLGRLDPMHPGVSVEPPTAPSARTRLEHIINTPVVDEDATRSVPTFSGQNQQTRRPRRIWMIVGAVAAAAAIAAIGIAAVGGTRSETTPVAAPMELSLPAANAASSCIRFDPTLLATMSPAFAGTVTSIDGDAVTLTVDRWYAGGDATTVVLKGGSGSPALEGGVQFEVGQRYLVTASEGTVNGCGYSGLATPDFVAAFDQAFGS
jgi:hypothetical protein